MPTIKELKTYLGIDGNCSNSLLANFLKTAKEMVEKILRYPISELEPTPSVINESLRFAVAYLYTNRETANIGELEKTLSAMLSALRKVEF